jgi:hypothetical protein
LGSAAGSDLTRELSKQNELTKLRGGPYAGGNPL